MREDEIEMREYHVALCNATDRKIAQMHLTVAEIVEVTMIDDENGKKIGITLGTFRFYYF